jgi:hypothetical protein
MEELQRQASLPGNDLESVFLKITEEEQSTTVSKP